MDIITNSFEKTIEWRERWGYTGRGGVVVVFNGEVQSWVNELRNPSAWRPGCIAFDESGRSWTAVVGNDNSGALMWLCNEQIPDDSQ